MYYDEATADDGRFYYNKLMQDFGWYENVEGNWSSKDHWLWGHNPIRKENGYFYVNSIRKVGVYFNPKLDGNYTAYKVKLKE